jgi:hypothetical protein
MIAPLIEKLATKQKNLADGLSRAHTRELVLERELQLAREARAACEGAKQQVDETLNALLELRDAPAALPVIPQPGARK